MQLDYQHEKLTDAIRILCSMTICAEDRIATAMNEFTLAYRHDEPPPDGQPHADKIRALMDTSGGKANSSEGLWMQRARELDESQRRAFTDAFVFLHDAVTRAFASSL